jgi:DNA-binding transcriptional ArsR family regulator
VPLTDDDELLRMLKLPAEGIRATAPLGHVPGPFVIAKLGPLKAAADALAGLRGNALMLWLFLAYETKRRRVDTVQVSNLALAEWGLERRLKYKALDRLEAAGLIKVLRSGRSSLRVRVTCT